jgi:hypothetical protein
LNIIMAPENTREPSETSPLLSHGHKKRALKYLEPHPIDPSGGIAPEGADPYDDHDDAYYAQNRDDVGANRGNIGDDVEGQSPAKQYEGMPEVKKQMKFILPAVAIGVFLAAADQTIIVSSYGRIGSELDALERTSWVATAYAHRPHPSHEDRNAD